MSLMNTLKFRAVFIFGLLFHLFFHLPTDYPDSANGVVYKGAFDNIARGIINGNLIEAISETMVNYLAG